jgi:hypothetical protein
MNYKKIIRNYFKKVQLEHKCSYSLGVKVILVLLYKILPLAQDQFLHLLIYK